MNQTDKAYEELQAAKKEFWKNHAAMMNDLHAEASKGNSILYSIIAELETIDRKFEELDKSIEELRQVVKMPISKEELLRHRDECDNDERLAEISDELDKMLKEKDDSNWQNSIELPNNNEDWQNEIQLPNDN